MKTFDLREMCRRLAVEVDELCEQRVERNAEIKRLREALEDIWEMYCDSHEGRCMCCVCRTVKTALRIGGEE
jgi:hypothetical protein